eukprot:9475854-Pyramimonas_sp.AAC.1
MRVRSTQNCYQPDSYEYVLPRGQQGDERGSELVRLRDAQGEGESKREREREREREGVAEGRGECKLDDSTARRQKSTRKAKSWVPMKRFRPNYGRAAVSGRPCRIVA